MTHLDPFAAARSVDSLDNPPPMADQVARYLAEVKEFNSSSHNDEQIEAWTDRMVQLADQLSDTTAATWSEVGKKAKIVRHELIDEFYGAPMSYVDRLLLSLLNDIDRLAGTA